MEEILGLLLSAVCVLTPFVLLGYGLIRLLAWLAKSPVSQPVLASPRVCPQCRAALTLPNDGCAACGWRRRPLARPPAPVTQPSELEITRRQLERLLSAGLIPMSTFETVRDGLDELLKRVAAGLATPPPLPVISVAMLQPLKPEEEIATAAAINPQTVAGLHPFISAARANDAQTPPPQVPAPLPEAPIAIDPRERVRLVAERQMREAKERAAEHADEPALPPPTPSQPWSQLLAAFMEDSNIRWGELVGGLLIVGCSIALVLSFWAQIAQQPLLKFGVFNGVTAGLFGIGFFIVRRWKLPMTGHGILLISTLLVPLDMLAIAAVTQGDAGGAWGLAGEAVSTLLLGALVYLAGRILVDRWRWLLTAAVIGPSLAGLAIARSVSPEVSLELLYALAAGPLCCYLATTAWAVLGLRRQTELSEHDAARLFKLLGMASFSAVLPLGLLVARTGRIEATLADLSPLVSLAAGPAIAVGLLLWRKLTSPGLTGLRTAGTAVGVCGTIVLAVGAALAWPQPVTLIPTCAVAAVTLAAIALFFKLPVAWLPATGCGTLAWLAGWHVATRQVAWHIDQSETMLRALLTASSGIALIPLAGLVGLAAGLAGRRRSDDARCLLAATAAIVAASLGLVSWYGFSVPGDPNGVAYVYAMYAAGAMVAAMRTRYAAAMWTASGLALAALVQGLTFKYLIELPWQQSLVTALLAHASLNVCGAVAGRLLKIGPAAERGLFAPLRQSATASGLLVVVLLPWFIGGAAEASVAAHLFWLAGIALALCWLTGDSWCFAGFQAALAGGTMFAVAARLATESWFQDSPQPWFDPWSLAAQGIALGALCLAFSLARLALRHSVAQDTSQQRSGGAQLLHLLCADRLTVDRALVLVVLAGTLFLGVYAGAPGVAQELSPRLAESATALRIVPSAASFALANMPHEHAQGFGAWLVVAVAVVLLIVRLWERFEPWAVIALLSVAAAACPLLAGRWEADVSTASALRWLATGYLALGALPIWFRGPLARLGATCGWPEFAGRSAGLSRVARPLVLTLSLAPLMAMAVYTGASAVLRVGLPRDVQPTLYWLLVLAGVGAFVSVTCWLSATVGAIGRSDRKVELSSWTRQAAAMSLILGVAPLLAMLLYVVAVALKQSPILGPEPGSFFGSVGLAVSYAVPVLVTGLVLVGHAARERSAGFAFAGGLVFNIGATAAYLLVIAKGGLRFDAEQWTRLVQLNAIVSASYAGLWIAARRWGRKPAGETQRVAGGLLATQTMLAPALNAIVLICAAAALFLNPWPSAFHEAIATPAGWLALAAAVTGYLLFVLQRGERLPAGAVAATLLGTSVMAACAVSRLGLNGGFHLDPFRTLLTELIGSGWLLLIVGWLATRRARTAESVAPEANGQRMLAFDVRGVTRWVSTIGALGMLFALRDILPNRSGPWWCVVSLSLLAALAAALACWTPARRFVYVAAGLVSLAVNVWWIDVGSNLFIPRQQDQFLAWLQINIIAIALPGVLWLVLELRVLRAALATKCTLFPCHRLVAALALVAVSALVALGLAADAAGGTIGVPPVFGWLTLAATAMAIIACLWDAGARFAMASLYLLGLAGVGMAVDGFNLTSHWLPWTGTMILAAYSIATSYLWSRREGLRVWGRLLRMPVAGDGSLSNLAWLVPANCLLAAAVVVSAFALDLTLANVELRLLTGKAALMQALAIGMLARGKRESELRAAALWTGAIGAVAWGWAWLDPATTGTFLNRAVVVTVALAATTVVYGLGLAKLLPQLAAWHKAARRMTPSLVVAAGLSLAVVLAAECVFFAERGAVPIDPLAIAAVAAALLGLAVAALVAAVVPGRDPLGLSERGRMAYVYAAEGLLALLCLHIRLTMPWLFHGFFARYWPLIVMCVAYVGVGLAEVFRRQQRHVLAEPLTRTGAFLPLLSVLGFWVLPQQVDYTLLLLSVGGLYAGLAATQRSFAYGICSALAANAALLFFFHRVDGFGLLDHPQLWLIPPALSALAAAWLNRERLAEGHQAAIRYAASTTIYTSSTADIFLNGVAEAPWLPVILAGLAIAGILAGIALRVRAFLFLGASFLVLALATIIWHAAVDLHQTWLVWVSGIVAGLLIIALFGTFERKRQEVLRLVEQIKQWQA